MAAQANFISGGLLLCVAMHHSATDGVGMATVLGMWAKWCRRGPGSDYVYGSEPEFISTALDRSPLMEGLAEAQAHGHKEYKTRALPSQELAKPATPSAVPGSAKTDPGICYFSADSLAMLRAVVSSSIPSASGCAPQPWISTNNALIALLWSCITKARLPRLQSNLMEDHEVGITLGAIVDGRSRLVPPLPHEYIGNACLLSSVTTPLSTLTSATPLFALGTLAVSIRKCIECIDDTHIRSVITFVDRAADVRAIIPGLESSFGRDIFSTSWADQDTMETDWGNVVGGVPTYLRVPKPECDGECVVYPRLLDQGLEVLIGLHADDMARLRSDELLCKFASWRC